MYNLSDRTEHAVLLLCGQVSNKTFRSTTKKMLKTIYVGNLPFKVTETEIQDLFAQHGKVQSVKLITDRETGKPRGFGFVEMDSRDAETAVAALNGYDFGGRTLRVNEAKEREGGGGGRGEGGGERRDRGGRGDRGPRYGR
jgi:RNA recognition motif-containing protein